MIAEASEIRTRIKKELAKIKRNGRGVIRPEAVVEFASDPDTALHSKFTWDDSTAAHNYRIWQARQILRVHVEIIESEEVETRAYVSLTSDRYKSGGGYRATVDVMSDEDMRAELLADALDELRVFRQKYAKLKELAKVFEAMDEVAA